MSSSPSRVVVPPLLPPPADQASKAELAVQARRLDAFGVLMSGICAVHCVVVALFLAAVPLAGATLLADPRVESLFVASALVIGLISLGLGFWRVHRDERPMILFAIGALFLLTVRPALAQTPVLEAAVVVLAAGAIITGHLWNRRLLHVHAACGTGHSHDRPHAI
jgi:hypothetical protein